VQRGKISMEESTPQHFLITSHKTRQQQRNEQWKWKGREHRDKTVLQSLKDNHFQVLL